MRCIWSKLRPEIVEVEFALGHLGRELLSFLDLDRLRGALDQADDVAHAEDSPGDPVGMEGFELVERLADAGELDRLAGNRAHRKRSAATCVAVHSGQDHARKVDLGSKALGDVDRVLASQAVDDEQGLGRVRRRLDGLHLCHQLVIDVQASRSVEQDNVIALELRRLDRPLGDLDRLLAGDDRERVGVRLPPEHRELLLRGRASDVERRHQDLLAVALAEPLGELGGGGRLARALEADHHDDGWWSYVKVELRGF